MRKFGLVLLLICFGTVLTGSIGFKSLAYAEDAKVKESAKIDEKKSEEKADKEPEEKGKYGDPTTCAALLDDKSYTGDFEQFKYMIAGRDSWVFRSRQDLKAKFDVTPADVAMHQELTSILKGKGIDFVMAYIPTRGMLASQFLLRQTPHDKNFDVAAAIASYDTSIKTLREGGVHIVGDSHPAAPNLYFNHADQHWTTIGSHSMAKAVATYIKARIPVASQLPVQAYTTTEGSKISYDGRFGEFIKRPCKFRPPYESDVTVDTKPAGQAGSAEALLADPKMASVVLVGTSNSKRDEFNSNFDGYLKQELSLDVYNAAIPGGGMDDSLLNYLVSPEFKKTPPKILIWEIPGYYDLGGAAMSQTLKQAVASVAGICDAPLVSFPKTKVVGKKLKIFEKLKDKKILANNAYIVLQFDEPVKTDFTMSVKTSDGKVEKYEFEQRKAGDGRVWYYFPKKEGELTLLEATLSVKAGIADKMLQAKLCPLQ